MRVALFAAFALVVLALDLAFLAEGKTAAVHQRPPAQAIPGLVWRSGGMALRLTDHSCPFEEMALQLEVEGAPPARAYVVTQGERKSTGCWVRDIGGDVLTRSPGGEEGTIPLDWFRSEPAT